MRLSRYKEVPYSLTIGFMGYDTQQTLYGMQQFAENNEEQIAIYKSNGYDMYLKDGTYIVGIFPSREKDYYKYRFDQLILFDDDRWNIIHERSEDIKIIFDSMAHFSCVPDEYKIMNYSNEN